MGVIPALIGGIGIFELIIVSGMVALVVLGVRYALRSVRKDTAPCGE